jgi:hypothetical protein
MILLILLVVLFLCALHGWYSIITNQFWSQFKSIETATLNSIISYISYHNGFQVVDHSKKGKPTSSPGPHVPAAASANITSNCQGKVWQFLSSVGSIWSKRDQGPLDTGNGWYRHLPYIDELPHHVPIKCPMLAELNLKLITCLAGGKPAPPLGPAPSPVPAPTPGRRAAAADVSSVSGSSGSSTAPSGLAAAVAPAPSPAGNYDI